ncbi:LacI family DNA-binding transcriptional regulator [Mycoplasma sp. Pen4]|uniref:LacI family DNA-binding transcriptional regulator n=1 Tax=Mycoplasma sp. Pen4 TaxID=640330 RepID=UPI00165463BD|nr:LacI family DNA-binding transcriptional regulator [Mycoplasma sp. Pen4]QNM93349.1 LacI family DNA-binding transcriptional regulator [Mycoplasma sp. Pen4]
MKKPISYKDISVLAGVSISTISRFYNNGYVSKKTRQKISAIIDQNEYVPNHGARIIKGKDTSVFVISPIYGHNYYNQIINGIIAACMKSGRRVTTTYTKDETRDYIETVRYVLSWKPTSIVLFVNKYDRELFTYLRNVTDVSIVVYGHEVPGVSWITTDEKKAFYELTKTFIAKTPMDQKEKKYIFLEDQKLTDIQKTERYEGFEQACRDLQVNHAKCQVHPKRKPEDISNIITYAKNNKYWNVVCSSHETFVSLSNRSTKNTLRLTDIGYQSIYDNLKTYASKIFIDYPLIGLEIERMIETQLKDNEVQTKVVELELIDGEQSK